MRTILAAAAAVLAVVAAIVAGQTGEADKVPFFIVMAAGAIVVASLTAGPWTRPSRLLARTIAVAWIGTAVWVAALLVWERTLCACSGPTPPLESPNVGGIPTTWFHLAATYLGGALVLVAAFSDLPGVRGAARR